MCDADSVQYFEQGATEAFPVMSIVEFGEPEERTFTLPSCGFVFLNPMACNGKITVGVTSLPCVAGDIDGPTNSVALV